MRKMLLLTLALGILLLPACHRQPSVSSPDPDPAPIEDPGAPAAPDPADERITAENYYALLEGSWRMISGETEGWEYDAREEDIEARLIFHPEGYVTYRYDDRCDNSTGAVFRSPAFTGGRLWDLDADWYVTLEDDLSGGSYVAGLDGERLVFANAVEGGTLFFEREDAPVLAAVRLYATREEAAAAADPLSFFTLEPQPYDEDSPHYWAVVTALRDDTRIRYERTERSGLMCELLAQDGFFLPGERIADITLSSGSSIAVEAFLPWVTALPVTASCGGYYGEYSLGSDNYLHLDPTGAARSIIGFSSPRCCADEHDLRTLLTGTWVYRDAGSGEITAAVTFSRSGRCSIDRQEESCALSSWFDRLYAADEAAPDMICFSPDDDALALLPDYFEQAGGGDYLIDFVPCDGEMLLQLSQANNGEGALTWLLPHAQEGNDYVFLLHRYIGAADAVPAPQSESFPAIVWKYDADAAVLWLQPVTIADEDEAGYEVYRPDPAVPAAPYPVADSGAVSSLRGLPDPEYPAEFFEVTVDAAGAVTGLT